MFTITKAAGRIAFAAVIATTGAFMASAASAGGGGFSAQVAVPVQPQVVVPAPLPTSWVDGCYRIGTPLYGPYNMTFCLDEGQGTYHVRGGGLDCRGDVDSDTYGMRVDIALSASRCGRGMAWTADTLSCQVGAVSGGYRPDGGNTGGAFGRGWGGGWQNNGFSAQAAVPEGQLPQVVVPLPRVPVPTYGASLRCTYQPAAYGYPTTVVTAERVS